MGGFLPDKEVETVVVVAHDRSGQLVLLGKQAVGNAPLIAVRSTFDAARPYRLAHLAPETVALGADGYATGEGALHLQPRIVTHPRCLPAFARLHGLQVAFPVIGMTDVRSQTAGDAGAVAFAVIGTADGVFSLPFLGNQSRLPVTGELQQVLAVLRLDEHAILVIRVEGDLPVILFLLQDIVQAIILVFRPFSSGTVHTGDTARTVALVLTPHTVEAGFRNDLSQSVQLEEIVVARLVADAPELQLTVVAEGDVVPFLLAAFQYPQRPIGKPDFADVVAGMDHVPHGIVLKPVHVAVRLFQPYQVVRPVVGITGNVAFHIHCLHKPSPAVVLPPAE